MIGLTCPRTTDPQNGVCALCGVPRQDNCPLTDPAMAGPSGPPAGGVIGLGTCDPDDGVCEACQ